ncbi:MAG: L,D-transpeptidase [Candidatus Binataceae bacterium]|nr:L,D-transpeptidase [Candidatus Binataceae bacterium]
MARRRRSAIVLPVLLLALIASGKLPSFAQSTAAVSPASTPGASSTPAISPSATPVPPTATATAATATPTATYARPAATPTATYAKPTAIATATPSVTLQSPSNRTPGVIALLNTKDGSERDPLNWSVIVSKSAHRLEVHYKGQFYRSYPAVFGRNLDTSAKRYAGDRRTPEGDYLIIRKYRNRRWRWFLKLNYPNAIDMEHYAELRAAREIPIYGGRQASTGNAIGIHGSDVPILNAGNVNWTTGCISVDNASIDELAALLPVGTLVVIKP